MLSVYNSLSRKKEPLKPLKGKSIGMYVCGPTVYGPGHIGHARTYVAFDIIRRYLEFSGYNVKFIVNITDVHDDMIKRANDAGTTIFELGKKFTKEFFDEIYRLEIKPASINPKVTEHIPEIIAVIEKLVKKGFAYETDDGVYFSVSKFPEYGKLSGVKVKKQVTGTRIATDKYEKEVAQDFALWKKAKAGEPSWKSPWGEGRPGWHIECSAMNFRHLGEQIDIHAGAEDLKFPHHENEIAQSEAASGKKPFVKYWLHSGFLNVEGMKMSKSLGNFIEIPELLETVKPKEFRMYVSMLNYGSRVNFTREEMAKVKKTLERLNLFIERMKEISGKKEKGGLSAGIKILVSETRKNFIDELDDNFNFPNAWAHLFELEKKTNKMEAEGKMNSADAQEVLGLFRDVNEIFNVFDFEKREDGLSAEEKKLIEKREKLRKEKKWKESDELRAELKKLGIQVDDTAEGMKWRRTGK